MMTFVWIALAMMTCVPMLSLIVFALVGIWWAEKNGYDIEGETDDEDLDAAGV